MPTEVTTYDAAPTELEGGGWDFGQTSGYDPDFAEVEADDPGYSWSDFTADARAGLNVAQDTLDLARDARDTFSPPAPPPAPGYRPASYSPPPAPAPPPAPSSSGMIGNPAFLAIGQGSVWILGRPYSFGAVVVAVAVITALAFLAAAIYRRARKSKRKSY